jgi:hypothetical protein
MEDDTGRIIDVGYTDSQGYAPYFVPGEEMYIIDVTHPDYTPLQWSQWMPDGQHGGITTKHMFPLSVPQPTYELTIEVADEEKQPVDLAKVTVFKNIGKDELFTDGQGRAIWTHTGIGAHTIWVEKQGYKKWSTLFTLQQASQMLSVELIFTGIVPITEHERLAMAIILAYMTVKAPEI